MQWFLGLSRWTNWNYNQSDSSPAQIATVIFVLEKKNNGRFENQLISNRLYYNKKKAARSLGAQQ